jgi:glycosyltransferase involved in cell wall biosynthesis
MQTARRIGIDARLIAYREGGIAEYTRRLIESLTALDPNDAYLILQGRRALQRPPIARNVRDVRMQTPPHHRLERIALGLETARLRLDLLHSPDFIPPRRLPIVGARHAVITIHDLNFLHYSAFQTPDAFRYYNGQIRAAVKHADHILTVSEAAKTDICEKLAVAPERITVSPNGVDPAFHPLSGEAIAAVRGRLNLPANYVLFVGTFEPRKNIPGLLKAYTILRTRLPDVPPLVLAGRRGWLYEPIFAEVAALGLTDRVIWLEDVAAADLPAVYNGANLLVLPSFYEGFGLPPLEAMACGVPVVVSNRSSLPEVVGEAGTLIDPDDPESLADGVYCVLTDSTRRETMRNIGLIRAADFTWKRTAGITLAVYRRVLTATS